MLAVVLDAEDDFPVWRDAQNPISGDATQALQGDAERRGHELDPGVTTARSLAPYIRALRPHQYAKNLFVFVPMLAAHELSWGPFAASFLALVGFSLVASSGYVLNDLLDLAADRAHPRKRLRVFASGTIPLAHGSWMVGGPLLAGLGIALTLGWSFVLVLLAYYSLVTAYSAHLKRCFILDICVLAALYTLRVVAGEIPHSVSLLSFSMFLFLSLAAVKRQAELVDMAERGQSSAVGRSYHAGDMPIVAMIGLGAGYVSVLVMALYVSSPDVANLYHRPTLLWGICCVLLYWITRMLMVTHRGAMHDDPLVYAANDKVSQVCLALVITLAFAGAVL